MHWIASALTLLAMTAAVSLCITARGNAQQSDVAIAFVQSDASPTAIRDEGLAGAQLAMQDNASSGRFVGQSYTLKTLTLRPSDDLAAKLREQGASLVVATLPPTELRGVAAALPQGLVFNAAQPDDTLRNELCAANLLHTIASRAMLADALAQYLVWKRWKRWFLVVGASEGDRLYADAVRRAAKKFGAELVVEKQWTFGTPQARSDTGHVTLQTEIPAFTRVADHDVLIVADENDAFGEYLIGRTTLPRPVAGTHGLVATGWSSVNEQWGATQLQARFTKAFGRAMTPIDYAAWLAVRAIGEAALRSRSTDAKAMIAYLRGPDFLLSGFKGQGQSFRAWDGQMRQPILIAGARLLVSVSPQAGFLHQVTPLDTLGADKSESRCKP